MTSFVARRKAGAPRLRVDVHALPGASALAAEVREALCRTPRSLPCKLFYDDRGSTLFDAICETPEYYPTRTELALLTRIAPGLLDRVRPTQLVELGSGAAKKTRALLDAAGDRGLPLTYVPFDVSEGMLRASAGELLASYPWLTVHGVVGDYDHHLDRLPAGARRLVAFLGGTIGNFDEVGAVRFLARIARVLGRDDRLLLGADLVKDRAVLHAAYNDAQGITAAFNKNALAVVNARYGADFDLDAFEHVAFFSEEHARIEMHLRSLRAQRVSVPGLDLVFDLAEGELLHTEISRKFTPASLGATLHAAGLELVELHRPENGWFALAEARRRT